ncbi:hypothetical protein BS47DRAFT_892906 [Hydnum rufescens UP504]|uniref:Rad60/SUMO-like domain-containing protein n=1 Tax=Hydnum rufescens UP504 TaxID=1448309 RepID=A0A9P6DWY0_9AGAM|nr:hypothetical protein BS47DRAFT_892906 [Hydnum rufescens UP504]
MLRRRKTSCVERLGRLCCGPKEYEWETSKAQAKSRSPTPPPALPEHFRNEARRIARQVVREQNPLPIIDLDAAETRRVYQPVLNIDSSEEDDPDFAAIAAKVRAEHKRKASALSSTQTNVAGPSRSSSGVKVKILVKWVQHPFDEFAQEQPEEAWNYFIDRDSNLREIFTTTTRLKHLLGSQLVVTHDGHQIYQTSTPRSLEGLAGEIHLSACDDNTYSHLQDMRKKSLASTGNDPRLEFGGAGGSNAPAAEDSDGEGDKPANDEPKKKIKIGLRSAQFPQTKYLNVRAEMTCRAILQHYLKVMKIEGKHDKARLSFDGEQLAPDSQIGDADIDLDDDEALVDVVGL